MIRAIDFDDNRVFHLSHPKVLSTAQKKWGAAAVEEFVRLGYYYYSLNYDCFYTYKDLVDEEVKLVDFTEGMNEKYFNPLTTTAPVYSGGSGGGGGSGGNFWIVLLLTLTLTVLLTRCVYG